MAGWIQAPPVVTPTICSPRGWDCSHVFGPWRHGWSNCRKKWPSAPNNESCKAPRTNRQEPLHYTPGISATKHWLTDGSPRRARQRLPRERRAWCHRQNVLCCTRRQWRQNRQIQSCHSHRANHWKLAGSFALLVWWYKAKSVEVKITARQEPFEISSGKGISANSLQLQGWDLALDHINMRALIMGADRRWKKKRCNHDHRLTPG